ncbi:MAG: hypothetical protein PVG14_09130 [Anaerolineales bacterium]
MNVTFKRHELPMAYSMIAAANRIKPRRDGRHPIDKFFLLWTAFNSIYTTIAHHRGHSPQLMVSDDGTIETHTNGNVKIPEVRKVSEREQIHLALEEFDDQLKHELILHESTKFFVSRTPYWQGKPIEHDAFGQRVNGVINVNYTTSSDYPIWSPVDPQIYEGYLENPDNEADRDFLSGQIVDLLYTVRDNLMHFGRKFDDSNDLAVFEKALPPLEIIVASFTL